MIPGAFDTGGAGARLHWTAAQGTVRVPHELSAQISERAPAEAPGAWKSAGAVW